MFARARVWQLHNHFQFVGPAHRRSLLRACCWLSDGSVGGERGGEFQTEPSSSKRAKRDDSVGSRGTWWTSLLGLDGPNSAYEQLNAAGGEASVFSNFLRIHPRHITTKLYAAHPPPPPTSFSLLPPAFSDGSVCVTVHAQKHAGMLVGFSHCVVLKAQTGSSETFNVGMRVCVRVCYTNHLWLCSRAWHCTLHCFVMFSRRPLTFFLTHVCDATVTCLNEAYVRVRLLLWNCALEIFWQIARSHISPSHVVDDVIWKIRVAGNAVLC